MPFTIKRKKPQWVGIVEHVSKSTIVDATDIYNKAMEAVKAGYLAVADGHCRFTVTDKGHELLKENGES